MADHVSPGKRSEIMAAVSSVHTSLELSLRRVLWHRGLRYRVNMQLAGARPDIAFMGARIVVFVDGCFWHGCPHCYVPPKTRTDFWTSKVERNATRDRRDTLMLEEAGWTVLRFWGCEIKESASRIADVVEAAVAGSRSGGKSN